MMARQRDVARKADPLASGKVSGTVRVNQQDHLDWSTRVDGGRAVKVASAVLAITASLLLSGCQAQMPVLEPEGPAAAHIADHWWLLFWLGMAVYIAVVALLLYAVRRSARQRSGSTGPPIGDRLFFTVAGLAIPSVILLVTVVSTISTGRAVIIPPSEPAVTIDVIGHQFWWEVHYPEQGIRTANEIYIPVGQPVELRLTSADVIHSFWVPRLGGKLDLNPGKTNVMWLQADEPGTYRGQCAEFCGIQHTHMALLVVAEPPKQFGAWARQHALPARKPDGSLAQRGQEVFSNAGCALCHRVAGAVEVDRTGTTGPDLTHFASRETIGAATVENSRDNLGQWILNPHEMKPGVRMPPTPLAPEELDALIAYLESLR